MAAINPDPHGDGFRFSPTYWVTAIYKTRAALANVLEPLRAAGFKETEVEIFVGPEGADKLDARAQQHGAVMRFLHSVASMFGDDMDVQHKFDAVLRSGGMVVNAFTNGEDAKKVRAGEILKDAGADEVTYWGKLTAEKL